MYIRITTSDQLATLPLMEATKARLVNHHFLSTVKSKLPFHMTNVNPRSALNVFYSLILWSSMLYPNMSVIMKEGLKCHSK